MGKNEENDLQSGTFTWKIDEFSKLNADKCYSEVFVIGGFKWRVSLYPKGNTVENFISMYMEVADSSTLPSGWTRYAKFSLTLVNQLDRILSITKDTEHEFNANENDWGFTRFTPLSEIHERDLVNDICIVEANVSVRKGDIKIIDNETGELMDFKGLGRIELAFHPLLEEVCLLHPSLIECQQRRSRTFVECAFTTLGRLLHFLKTTKVKDLNQDGYERLQILWDELESFKFDLTWLQPHVQSVFGMKNMTGRVDRMREDVNVLESEIRRRRAMLAAAEVDLERAKEDLVKAEQGFKKIGDVDCVIDYPLA
ncbi:putative ubiquitinyl hydrolase 1 [Rosa chinensis]|uniref:Putative ubiquitinyl hydrolase 1 n=1 Tax=Rosa chinensis TaxID=74649 RepID=A0A2P6SBA2_ROSCH|nr:MATH domain and coiled-coil domain-containing protein At3g58250 [Rosa chinensis]XP_024192388.1 MATH domain and coiled-coil domain-containing protein At3g58250 [Rosa chinensis]XP_040366310.1 MATH domain and coiled-coil domain-containing protein At3g58250 [Rosa chinensis]XP_040366312.1 MATH domain and coiled-coil domain-containing protein At3g58250 [Rosa chinensis]XP_040366313.1 MATH domain and coiled-coil domain-containing protein At3g58250 [Rosa chinensis]XP_040366315.1 MATH domain and coil